MELHCKSTHAKKRSGVEQEAVAAPLNLNHHSKRILDVQREQVQTYLQMRIPLLVPLFMTALVGTKLEVQVDEPLLLQAFMHQEEDLEADHYYIPPVILSINTSNASITPILSFTTAGTTGTSFDKVRCFLISSGDRAPARSCLLAITMYGSP